MKKILKTKASVKSSEIVKIHESNIMSNLKYKKNIELKCKSKRKKKFTKESKTKKINFQQT